MSDHGKVTSAFRQAFVEICRHPFIELNLRLLSNLNFFIRAMVFKSLQIYLTELSFYFAFRPEFNFTSQYLVRVDDFFLHFLQKVRCPNVEDIRCLT